ncbi:class I SAM-dependent methyltransferase [Patescibacteria group bacterium]|nr:class I SAM-dependent methyltransferase [Patescibacteria group bacterium]
MSEGISIVNDFEVVRSISPENTDHSMSGSLNNISENLETSHYEIYKGKAASILKSWDKINSAYRELEYDRETYENYDTKIRFDSIDRQATMIAVEVENTLGIIDMEEDITESVLLLSRLAQDKNFEARKELTKFLACRLCFASNTTGRSFNKDGLKNPKYVEYRDKIIPFLEDSMTTLAMTSEQEDLIALRESLEYLASAKERGTVFRFLTQEDLDSEARLKIAVETMNVFGVVSTIEGLLLNAENNPDVLETVRTIQGESGAKVMTTLSAVYQAVEFRKYALNNEKQTKAEVERIRLIVEDYASKKGIPPEKVKIADIGAGTGRHSILLHEQGLDVTAYEYEEKHVHQIKEDAPNLKVVQVDWHNMPLPKATEKSFDNPEIMFCLGRTILHNNTPEKMARFFDEMHRILQKGGEMIIDIPEIPEIAESSDDEYSSNTRDYSAHLESLGVLPQRARNIYDGPDELHKYNRMAMTRFQFESYAKLFGFKVQKLDTVPIGKEGLFDNSYYKIEKDPDFDISSIPTSELFQMLYGIGLYHPSVDYNRNVDAWGVPLGVPFVYSSWLKGSIEDLREQVKRGEMSPIRLEIHNGRLVFRM